MPKYDHSELLRLHNEAKSADREATSEFRSSILLLAGEHYTRRMTEWWNRSRTTGQTAETYKLRITKNWLHRAHRMYMQSILGLSPGTSISPQNEMELQDQKDAELNQSVWEYIKKQVEYTAFVRDMVADFTGPGECAVKVYFDPTKGDLKGFEPLVDEETGEMELDEFEQPIVDETKPVFSGKFVFERLYAHALFIDPAAKQFKNARWVGYERMLPINDLMEMFKDDPEKKKYIQASTDEYVVFDSTRGGYNRVKDQCLILEYVFKPSPDYPQGYYYLATKAGILDQGELPFGVFPIHWCGFDESATKARATGIVKIARPWQAEINRASSQAAMHQVTIGEDKVLYQAGTKVTQGALLPGVRGITYNGSPPTILPGRAGDQYFNYIKMQEEEMSRALMLDLLGEEKQTNLDPMALLYRSMTQTQRFSFYSQKFGEFLVKVTTTALELARHYLDDEELVGAIGRSEVINIAEFRKTTPLRHRIHIQEQNDTIETKLGKQLVMNHLLQYVGSQLSREDIGKLIGEMPFGNWKSAFSEFTLDSRNIKNDFLAIERGEMPQISQADDSSYVLRQLAARKKERDFGLLAPEVQELYMQYEQYHIQKQADEAAAAKAAQSEFIPTGGALIACDFYVPADDPTKAPKRVRLPYQALDWLVKVLEQQGMTTMAMEQMNEAQLAEVANLFMSQGQGQGGPQVAPSQGIDGQASPGGMMYG